MDSSYWLVNSNRSRIKRFIENTNNKDQFLNIGLLIMEKFTYTLGKEPQVMTTSEEWKKLIAQGWRRTEEDWTKKES